MSDPREPTRSTLTKDERKALSDAMNELIQSKQMTDCISDWRRGITEGTFSGMASMLLAQERITIRQYFDLENLSCWIIRGGNRRRYL